MRTAAIILAAGASTRMGSAKQLLAYHGRPLLVHAVHQALASAVERVYVVVGANAAAVGAAVQALSKVVLVENPNWELGMGTSVRAGMAAATPAGFDAIILMLGDQPLISPEIINHLIAMHEESGKPLVAARYAASAGVPALFSHVLFAQLLNIPPASGCKRLIEALTSQSAFLDCPEAELDIDTPDDLSKANDLSR